MRVWERWVGMRGGGKQRECVYLINYEILCLVESAFVDAQTNLADTGCEREYIKMCNLLVNNVVNDQPTRKYHK